MLSLHFVWKPDKTARFRYDSRSDANRGWLETVPVAMATYSSTSHNSSSKRKQTAGIQILLQGGNLLQLTQARIRCSVVSTDHPHKPHMHLLASKEPNAPGSVKYLEAVAASSNGWIATFPEIAIIRTKDSDREQVLLERLIEELDQTTQSFSDVVARLKPKARTLAKETDSSKVRLKFEVVFEEAGMHSCDPLYSDVITNASKELRIIRTFQPSGPCSGGTDVDLWVKGVTMKDQLKVRFFDDEPWPGSEVYIKQSDIHERAAVAFKTPAYKNQSITDKVNVWFQLIRGQDETSEKYPFVYLPFLAGNRGKRLRPSDQDYETCNTTNSVQHQQPLGQQQWDNGCLEDFATRTPVQGAFPNEEPQIMPLWDLNCQQNPYLTLSSGPSLISHGFGQQPLKQQQWTFEDFQTQLADTNIILNEQAQSGPPRDFNSQQEAPHLFSQGFDIDEFLSGASKVHADSAQAGVNQLVDTVRLRLEKAKLEQGIGQRDLNSTDAEASFENPKGDTILHSLSANLEQLKQFLKTPHHAVFINQQNYYGQTALHYAVESAGLEAVKLLLQHGADPNIPDYTRGNTSVHLAAEFGFKEIFYFLQSQENCDMDAERFDGLTPLEIMQMMDNSLTSPSGIKDGIQDDAK